MDRTELENAIRELAPWHHDIEIDSEFSTGKVFSPTGKLEKSKNDGVTLISPREKFTRIIDGCYPDGMEGVSFLDCACNAGAYCFMSREFGARHCVGFDVREHWINQAKFVQQHRTYAPVDNVEFHVKDLYDVPDLKLQQFDFVYFSGIFYHLPDPVTGLKIAADLAKDIIYVSTAGKAVPENPGGMTMARESTTNVMSGVHEMSWFPNGVECLHYLLIWLGFKDIKLFRFVEKKLGRIRMELIASRTEGRLEKLAGEQLDNKWRWTKWQMEQAKEGVS